MSDTPARFRRRPLEVTAVQWTGDNLGVVEAFVGFTSWGQKTFRTVYRDGDDLLLFVESREARERVHKGDWIVAEPDGSGFYARTQERFAAGYEAVEE